MTELSVLHWPDQRIRLDLTEPLLIVAVNTPETSIRDTAQQQVRDILRAILAPYLGCSPPEVPLISQPGQPPRLQNQPQIGLSISHETGLSLLAINLAGPVGVDLMRLPEKPAWADEIDRLASDYLACRITGKDSAQRQENFAAAWTAHEAKLKYLGLGLTEWNTALQEKLAGHLAYPLLAYPLEVSEGFRAAVASSKSR